MHRRTFLVAAPVTVLSLLLLRSIADQGYDSGARAFPGAERVVGRSLPATGLWEYDSNLLSDFSWSRDSTDVVLLLLGARGCYPDQAGFLRQWQAHSDSIYRRPPIALLADPLIGLEQAMYDVDVLRRISGVSFRFVISTDSVFDLRSIRAPLPQAVVARSGRVVSVLPAVAPRIGRQRVVFIWPDSLLP